MMHTWENKKGKTEVLDKLILANELPSYFGKQGNTPTTRFYQQEKCNSVFKKSYLSFKAIM